MRLELFHKFRTHSKTFVFLRKMLDPCQVAADTPCICVVVYSGGLAPPAKTCLDDVKFHLIPHGVAAGAGAKSNILKASIQLLNKAATLSTLAAVSATG